MDNHQHINLLRGIVVKVAENISDQVTIESTEVKIFIEFVNKDLVVVKVRQGDELINAVDLFVKDDCTINFDTQIMRRQLDNAGIKVVTIPLP